MTAELVISRLDKVKQVGPGKWQSLCPVHDDRDPSLSVAIGDNGNTLIHCHAGCSTDDVLASIGLRYRDLFRDEFSKVERGQFAAKRSRDSLERALFVELHVLAQYVGERFASRELERDGKFRYSRPEWMPFPDDHMPRELQAVQRIRKGLGALYE